MSSRTKTKDATVDVVCDPDPRDILLGRGYSNREWPGNMHFHKEIRVKTCEYFSQGQPKKQKHVIVASLLENFRRTGRHFLRNAGTSADGNRLWVDCTHEDKQLVRKIAQAIRGADAHQGLRKEEQLQSLRNDEVNSAEMDNTNTTSQQQYSPVHIVSPLKIESTSHKASGNFSSRPAAAASTRNANFNGGFNAQLLRSKSYAHRTRQREALSALAIAKATKQERKTGTASCVSRRKTIAAALPPHPNLQFVSMRSCAKSPLDALIDEENRRHAGKKEGVISCTSPSQGLLLLQHRQQQQRRLYRLQQERQYLFPKKAAMHLSQQRQQRKCLLRSTEVDEKGSNRIMAGLNLNECHGGIVEEGLLPIMMRSSTSATVRSLEQRQRSRKGQPYFVEPLQKALAESKMLQQALCRAPLLRTRTMPRAVAGSGEHKNLLRHHLRIVVKLEQKNNEIMDMLVVQADSSEYRK